MYKGKGKKFYEKAFLPYKNWSFFLTPSIEKKLKLIGMTETN